MRPPSQDEAAWQRDIVALTVAMRRISASTRPQEQKDRLVKHIKAVLTELLNEDSKAVTGRKRTG